jgi:hypothetical protein
MPDVDRLIVKETPALYARIRTYADQIITEKEFRQPVEAMLTAFAEQADIDLRQRDEYTLVETGRADTVYNRLIIEYNRPGHLSEDSASASNRGVVQQIKEYIETVSKEHHHKLSVWLGLCLMDD